MAFDKEFQVHYNITANSTKAVEAVEALSNAIKNTNKNGGANGLLAQLEAMATSLQTVSTSISGINSSLKSLTSTPLKVDTSILLRQLTVLENAAKATANNVRTSLENAFSGKGGSLKGFVQSNAFSSVLKDEIARLDKLSKDQEKAINKAKANAANAAAIGRGATYSGTIAPNEKARELTQTGWLKEAKKIQDQQKVTESEKRYHQNLLNGLKQAYTKPTVTTPNVQEQIQQIQTKMNDLKNAVALGTKLGPTNTVQEELKALVKTLNETAPKIQLKTQVDKKRGSKNFEKSSAAMFARLSALENSLSNVMATPRINTQPFLSQLTNLSIAARETARGIRQALQTSLYGSDRQFAKTMDNQRFGQFLSNSIQEQEKALKALNERRQAAIQAKNEQLNALPRNVSKSTREQVAASHQRTISGIEDKIKALQVAKGDYQTLLGRMAKYEQPTEQRTQRTTGRTRATVSPTPVATAAPAESIAPIPGFLAAVKEQLSLAQAAVREKPILFETAVLSPANLQEVISQAQSQVKTKGKRGRATSQTTNQIPVQGKVTLDIPQNATVPLKGIVALEIPQNQSVQLKGIVKLEIPQNQSIQLKGKVGEITIPKKTHYIDVKARSGMLNTSIRDAFNQLKSGGAGKVAKNFPVNIVANATALRKSVRAALANQKFTATITPSWGNAVTKQKNFSALKQGLPSVKVILDISEAQAQIKRLAEELRALGAINPKVGGTGSTGRQNQRSSSGVITTNERAATGRDTYAPRGGIIATAQNQKTLYERARKRFYPLTGNTSFGARTPMFLDMAKGMGVMYGVTGAMSGISNSFRQAIDYQNAMTTTEAILKNNEGYSKAFFDDMAKIVRATGVRTKFTALEEAEAAKFLAMAGMNANKIKAAINPVTNIALAGDLDLGTTADKMTNIMTAFGLKEAKDFEKTADILANTFTKSNVNMMQLAESAQYAAPIASELGMKMEEMFAMIGVMGNAGIQGSMAGTSLRMMMQNIYKPTKGQKKIWDQLQQQYGIRRYDKNGDRRSVGEIMSDIADVVPQKQLAELMMNLFRITSAAGATTVTSHIGTMRELLKSNLTKRGTAENIAEARINTVQGQIAQMKSAFSEAILQIFESGDIQKMITENLKKLTEFFKSPEGVKALRDAVDLISSIIKGVVVITKMWYKIYNTFGPAIKTWIKFSVIFGMFSTQVGYLMTPFIQVIGLFDMLGLKLRKLSGEITMLSTTAGAGGFASRAAGGTAIGVAAMANGRGGNLWKNFGANSALASSVLIGGVAQPQLASEYAKRAALYRQAVSRNQQYLNAMMAATTVAQLTPNKLSTIQSLRAQTGRYASRAHQYEMAAWAARMRQAEEAAHRREVMRRANAIYGSGRVTRSFNAGRALTFASMLSFMPKWSAISRGFFAIISKLTYAFGALLSPVGLVTAALAVLGGAAYVTYNKRKAASEKLQRQIESDRKHIKSIQDNYTGAIASSTTPVNKQKLPAAINQTKPAEKQEVDKLVKNSRGFETLFGGKPISNESTYYNALWSNHIAPMSEALFGKALTRNEFASIPLNQIGKENTDWNRYNYQNYINSSMEEYAKKAAIFQITIDNSNFKKNLKEAEALQRSFYSLSAAQRTPEAFDKYFNSLRAIRDRYTPNDYTRKDISKENNLGNLRASQVYESIQGQQFAYDFFNSLLGKNPINKGFAVRRDMDDLRYATPYTTEWHESLTDILNKNIKLPFEDAKGVIHQIPILFDKNGIVWDDMRRKLGEIGVLYGNKEQERLNIITTISSTLLNIPGMEEIINKLGGIERIVANISGPTYNPYQDLIDKGVLGAESYKNPLQQDAEEAGKQSNNWKGVTPFQSPWGLQREWGEKKKKETTPQYLIVATDNSEVNKTQPNQQNSSPDPKKTNDDLLKNLGDTNSKNDKYASRYKGTEARPTQIIINIDKLAHFASVNVSQDNKEIEIAEAMQDKITQAVLTMFSQATEMASGLNNNNAV